MKVRQKYKVFHNQNTLFIGDHAEAKDCVDIAKEDILNLSGKKILRELDQHSLRVATNNSSKVRKAIRGKFKDIKAAGGIVRNAEGQTLFILRHGFWDLPKGKMEGKESIEECAVREVSEECGIPLKYLKVTGKPLKTQHIFLSGKGNPIWKKTYWFPMQLTDECQMAAQTEEGITEVRFVDATEMMDRKDIVTYPLIRDVVRISH